MTIDLAENAEKALRMVREATELVYDVETSGLDWRVHAPVGYVVGAGAQRGRVRTGTGPGAGIYIAHTDSLPSVGHVVYVPIRHGGGGNLLGGVPLASPEDSFQIHDFEIELAKAFDYRNQNRVGVTIGHHLKFDAHMSANAGIHLGRFLKDTSNLGPILNEYLRSYSLENLANIYNVTAKKGQELYEYMAGVFSMPATKKIMSEFWRLSGTDQMGYDYAVGDGITTLELFWRMMKDVEEEELERVADLENDLIWTLFRMERKGIRIDEDVIEELKRTTENKINEELRDLGPGFNVRSGAQIKTLMESHGLLDWPVTEKGNPSFTEKWLSTHEPGQKIVGIRQKTNLLNSFVNPLRERHMYKGRVHATLNQLKNDNSGTISGRFSCSEPNLQQVPKRNKELAKPFRRLFIPDEGKIFWERDWSQCEPRLFAHYSGDKNLLEGYNSTPFRDAHQVVADLLDVERDPTAKRMNMGIFTGMQPKSFAGHMGWEYGRAAEAHAKWFNEFPDVRKFQNNAKARLKNRGYVYTLYGRRCRLEHARFAYRGTSKIIQGSNADIAKYKLLEMDIACEAANDIVEVLMTVHDSYNGQREDTKEAKQLMEHLVHIMEDVQGDPFNLRVPFVAEGFEGPNWSVASFGDNG